MRIAVTIATTGRPDIVRQCVERISRQARRPDSIFVCGAAPEDISRVVGLDGVDAFIGKRGATCQRNALIERASDKVDVMMFIDDDFLMHTDYLARVESIFLANPDILALNGVPIADGVRMRDPYTFESAEELLRTHELPSVQASSQELIQGVYGCNFAARQAPILEHGIRFDERLPLYAWQEDIDFSTQISRHGKVLRSNALAGVHLGVKGGRTSGLRLGYSQVVNCIYLARKGTMRPAYAIKLIARNFAANLLGSVAPAGPIDRRGRLRGNLMGLQDILLRGRVTPERILEL